MRRRRRRHAHLSAGRLRIAFNATRTLPARVRSRPAILGATLGVGAAIGRCSVELLRTVCPGQGDRVGRCTTVLTCGAEGVGFGKRPGQRRCREQRCEQPAFTTSRGSSARWFRRRLRLSSRADEHTLAMCDQAAGTRLKQVIRASIAESAGICPSHAVVVSTDRLVARRSQRRANDPRLADRGPG